MGKIYKNQTSLSLVLDTKVDLSTASSLKIQYRKPDGTTGTDLTGTLSGTTKILYNFASPAILTTSGLYIFWAFVTFADGRVAYGRPVEIMVYETGD